MAVFVHMCVCMFTSTCVCTYVCVRIHAYITRMRVHMHAWCTFACPHTSMMHVCVFSCSSCRSVRELVFNAFSVTYSNIAFIIYWNLHIMFYFSKSFMLFINMEQLSNVIILVLKLNMLLIMIVIYLIKFVIIIEFL